MRTILVLAALLASTLAAAPAAAEHACVDRLDLCVHWDCLQVYPWSRLCGGDVVGFLEAVLEWLPPEWGNLCHVFADPNPICY